jgi:hypothetical protein
MMFGEIGFKKIEIAFVMYRIYFIARLLLSILGLAFAAVNK